MGTPPPPPPGRDRSYEDSDCIALTGKATPGNPLIATPIIDPDECNALACTEQGMRVPKTRVAGTSGPRTITNKTIDVIVLPPADGDCPQTYTVSADAILAPDECNGLTTTASGLLAPKTRVVGTSGPAPGRIADDLQSVDVIVTAPAPDTCPQTYTVKAYLTPLRGEAGPVTDVDLLPTRTSQTWADTPLQVTLPDPGTYLVTGDIDTTICATLDYGSSTNLWTEVRLVNVASGSVELGPRQSSQHQYSTAPETRFQHCQHGPTPLSGLVTVSAEQGSKTVRVQATLHGGGPGNGLNGSTIEKAEFVGTRSYLTWVKIAD